MPDTAVPAFPNLFHVNRSWQAAHHYLVSKESNFKPLNHKILSKV
jgi:hypothetical protein